jgi:hypothetical protein
LVDKSQKKFAADYAHCTDDLTVTGRRGVAGADFNKSPLAIQPSHIIPKSSA